MCVLPDVRLRAVHRHNVAKWHIIGQKLRPIVVKSNRCRSSWSNNRYASIRIEYVVKRRWACCSVDHRQGDFCPSRTADQGHARDMLQLACGQLTVRESCEWETWLTIHRANTSGYSSKVMSNDGICKYIYRINTYIVQVYLCWSDSVPLTLIFDLSASILLFQLYFWRG